VEIILLALFCEVCTCSHLRYAVCLTGDIRGLDGFMASNIKTNLLAALPNASVVDVFAVFSMGDIAANLEPNIWSAIQLLNPVELSFHFLEDTRDGDNLCPNRSLSEQQAVFSHKGRGKMVSQWDKISSCHAALAQKEVSVGKLYDYVIRCRPDIYFFHPVSSWFHDSPEIGVQVGETYATGSCSQWIVANDHFAIIPRLLSKIYASAAESVRDCTPASKIIATSCHDCSSTHAECFLSYHLISRNVTFSGLRRSYGSSKYGNETLYSLWTVARKVNGTWYDRFRKWPLTRLETLPRKDITWNESEPQMLSRTFRGKSATI